MPAPPAASAAATAAPPSRRSSDRGSSQEALRAYQLLEALRRGDEGELKQLLDETAVTDAVQRDGQRPNHAGSQPLHLAVRCAKLPTVELVYKHDPAAINVPDSRGQTPLHLAAALDRRDVLALFLAQDNTDDMIRDQSGKTCFEVAATPEAASLISVSRNKWNEMFLSHLAAYIASPHGSESPSKRDSALLSPRKPPASLPSAAANAATATADAVAHSSSHTSSTSPHAGVSAAAGHLSNVAAERLYHFVAKPRARCCDFAMRDPASGTTVLHEAAKRKDLALIKLVLSRDADVLARDKRGKLPIDLAKDERIKEVLRKRANSEGRALARATSSAGTDKTVTPASGAKFAGFTSASAAGGGAGGSAAPSVSSASSSMTGVAPPLPKQPVMKGYLQKWTNLAKGYKPRWFVLENGILSYYRNQSDEGNVSRGSISMTVAKVEPPGTDKLKFVVGSKIDRSSSVYLKGNHPVEVMRWIDAIRQSIDITNEGAALQRTNTTSGSVRAPSISEPNRPASLPRRGGSPHDSFAAASIDGDNDTFRDDDEDSPPHAEDFHLMGQNAKTQVEASQQLLESIDVSADAIARQQDVKDALRRSLASLATIIDDYIDVVEQREQYFQRRYENEVEAKRQWEESMKEVAAQHAALELELQRVARDNTRRKRALQEVRANLGAISPALSPQTSIRPGEGPHAYQQQQSQEMHTLPEDGSEPLPSPLRLSTPALSQTRSRGATTSSMSPTRIRTRAGTVVQPRAPAELEQIVQEALKHDDGADTDDSDDDDEFFEAIEAGELPLDEDAGERVTAIDHAEDATSGAAAATAGAPHMPKRTAPAAEYIKSFDPAPYAGYEHPRTTLPITSDNRPSVSLWAILKGSIGKDLTKISFPVYFNEPTSMLQRMAEDMEFSECLDAAAKEKDSTKRIAYVAAFAMSNYSSTIGRISKPFNPLISETFEYVEPRKQYRYISEQVSHHPPISACIGQSPSWEYFGMVDAKSKFMGKSFEIRPTGTAHVTLRIPEEWAHPDCPPCKTVPGLREEHYSWLKVTTSVSNFLLGNPIIDHYGDMVITNHRTGETCTLTFKPRGWRGGNASEIKGDVKDAQGRKCWDIAGKWSSQLVARRVGAGHGELAPDATIPTDGAGEVVPEYIRLWKNSEKPPKTPFGLTPFAITLNDLNDALRPWLPPTDCRLRPDQHAFEAGQFERANELKSELEEFQRATRRKRETGELPPHKPRWFSRSVDPDTGELMWQPARHDDGQLDYWLERTRVGTAKLKGEPAEWQDVDQIFVETEH
ncbi:hypothetical protein JCM3774_003542 [Rhodotorula dairenensis]